MTLTTRAVAGQFVFTAFAFAPSRVFVLPERFLGVVRRAELELRAADVLSLRSRVGRARGLAAAVAARAVGLDRSRRCSAATCRGGDDEPRARRASVSSAQASRCSFSLRRIPSNGCGRAAHGRDLNPPLLQDPALAIHPPMLYTGYVGMSVPFAFAVAAMLEGKLDSLWARWVRPWTTVAWMFLTVGIALGSWWAYYELGWGGWWFWDPVENASFMPWLVGTGPDSFARGDGEARAVQELDAATGVIAFSLSLLGTFLVRSGVVERARVRERPGTRVVHPRVPQ